MNGRHNLWVEGGLLTFLAEERVNVSLFACRAVLTICIICDSTETDGEGKLSTLEKHAQVPSLATPSSVLIITAPCMRGEQCRVSKFLPHI